jgi:hypothetical protein
MRRSILFKLGTFLAVCATVSCADDPTTGPGDLGPQANILEPILGRMTGGGRQVVFGGASVTRGFTLHCDITLSNNLEINWGGNHWHLDKPLTSADCYDDPDIAPEPPDAPFDTFIGEGIGRLNGVDGYYIRIKFVDAGEPNGRNDTAGLMILDPNGNPVLIIPQGTPLDNGNNQAHYDQPHK